MKTGGEIVEIERKFLISKENLPKDIERYSFHLIEQAYLCMNPVIRIRRQDEQFILTYKGRGMMTREEYNLPLTKEGYLHLLKKADGILITKKRYLIPLESGHTAELDEFYGEYQGLLMAEVEFSTEEEANSFIKPDWFGEDVTFNEQYHNSYMSAGRK